MAKVFTVDEVKQHNKQDDNLIIVHGDVYDVTAFKNEHPGGKKILERVAGKDATAQFDKYHKQSVLEKYKGKLMVGSVGGKAPAPTPAPAPAPKKEEPKPVVVKTPTPVASTASAEPAVTSQEPYGDLIPYGDPGWYQSYHSPYYKASHVALRNEVRAWVTEEIEPYVTEWDEARSVPDKIFQQMGERGYLAGLLGVKYPVQYTDRRVASVPPEEWDHFHELIVTDELSRTGSGGFVWSQIGGYGIGLPPVIRFGREEVKKRILPGLLAGQSRICLAITEPDAGSDVANLTCEAKLTEDGKHYIVNGEKKWITNGIWSDYFTTAVRTGGPGMGGVSVLLIEKTFPGVSVRKMDCQGVWSSGTTYITFEDVKVPVENLIGKENQGFKVIMTNFNHERLGIVIQCNRFSRVLYEESMKYANKRKTFGKKLVEHPVIRMKLAQMARQVEACHNWLENIVYQCEKMGTTESMLRLGGAIAGLKAQATTTFEFCAREAAQIFGGLAYTRGGQGAKVERLYRDVKAYMIPGGSLEIMEDLSIRQALKVHEALGMKL
ncbi:hypothetical protein ABW19_dt0208875 [Dactylella cylindrospora]|nr:hypothetical protein ABW19_dt0208875 [Dactylella cylindrospora]